MAVRLEPPINGGETMTRNQLRALARAIIHAENNMTRAEYIQDVKDEIREEGEHELFERGLHDVRAGVVVNEN